MEDVSTDCYELSWDRRCSEGGNLMGIAIVEVVHTDPYIWIGAFTLWFDHRTRINDTMVKSHIGSQVQECVPSHFALLSHMMRTSILNLESYLYNLGFFVQRHLHEAYTSRLI